MYKLKGGRVFYNPNAGKKWRGMNPNGMGDARFLNLLNVRCIEKELENVPKKYKRFAKRGEKSVKGYLYPDSYNNIFNSGPYEFSLSHYVNRFLQHNNDNQIKILKANLEDAKTIREEDRRKEINKGTRTSREVNNHDKIIKGINNLIEKVTLELRGRQQQQQQQQQQRVQHREQKQPTLSGFAALYSSSDEEDSSIRSSTRSSTRSSKSKTSKSKSNTRSAGNIKKSQSKRSQRKKSKTWRKKKKQRTKKNK